MSGRGKMTTIFLIFRQCPVLLTQQLHTGNGKKDASAKNCRGLLLYIRIMVIMANLHGRFALYLSKKVSATTLINPHKYRLGYWLISSGYEPVLPAYTVAL